MAIKSYLIYPKAGKKDTVQQELHTKPECSVIPALNQDVLVLVTDTTSPTHEKSLEGWLDAMPDISNKALVSGYNI